MEILKVLKEKLGEEIITEEFMDELKAQVDVIVAEKVLEQKQALEESTKAELETEKLKLEESLRKEADEYKTELVESIDGYLEYAVKEFFSENKIAIENEFTVKAARELIESFANVLENNHFNVEIDQTKKIEKVQEEVNKLNKKLKEVVSENINLKHDIGEYRKSLTFTKLTEGLSKAKVEKVLALTEGIEFKDDKDFERKIKLFVEKVKKPEGEKLEEKIEPKEELTETKKKEQPKQVDNSIYY